MGVYTNLGRNLRARDFISHVPKIWIVLSRNDYIGGLSSPWPNESVPPAEVPTDGPSIPEFSPSAGCKRADEASLVKQDTNGNILFGGVTWSRTTGDDAKYVYLKFTIQPDDFTVNGDGQATIAAYRRLCILLDATPFGNVNALTARYDILQQGGPPFPGAGYMVFYTNDIKRVRGAGEVHVLEIILPM